MPVDHRGNMSATHASQRGGDLLESALHRNVRHGISEVSSVLFIAVISATLARLSLLATALLAAALLSSTTSFTRHPIWCAGATTNAP